MDQQNGYSDFGPPPTRPGEPELAAELIQEAESIDASLRSGWRARSRALLEAARESSHYGPELAPLIRAARAAWSWRSAC